MVIYGNLLRPFSSRHAESAIWLLEMVQWKQQTLGKVLKTHNKMRQKNGCDMRRCERLFHTDSEVKPVEVTVIVWFLQTVDASNIRDFRKMLQDLPKFHESPI